MPKRQRDNYIVHVLCAWLLLFVLDCMQCRPNGRALAAFSVDSAASSSQQQPRHYIGFDLGTSGCRISVIQDKIEPDSSYPEVYTQAVPWQDGDDGNQNSRYDDPTAWMQAVTTLLTGATQALTSLDTVVSICVSGTSASCLLLDRTNSGAPTRRPKARMYNYNVVEDHPDNNRFYGLQALEVLEQYAPPRHTALSATGSLAKLLAWHMEQPLQNSHIAGTEVLCHQADYVALQFLKPAKTCGAGAAKNHVTVSSDWHNCLKLGYDVQALAWPAWLQNCLQSVGVSLSVLPATVVSPGQIMGTISADAANQFGLPPTTVMVGGTTDSNAAFLAAIGSLQASQGTAVVSLGSTLAIKQLSDVYVEDATMGVYSHRFPDVTTTTDLTKAKATWLVGGASNVGCAILRQEGFSNEELDELSQDIDPSQDSSLCYYPLTKRGERFPTADGSKEPVLEPKPESRKDYLHGILQSISDVERDGFLALGHLGASPSPPTQIWTAGGGSRNDMWGQMRQRRLREAFQSNSIEVQKAKNVEASYGAAILAAAAFS